MKTKILVMNTFVTSKMMLIHNYKIYRKKNRKNSLEWRLVIHFLPLAFRFYYGVGKKYIIFLKTSLWQKILNEILYKSGISALETLSIYSFLNIGYGSKIASISIYYLVKFFTHFHDKYSLYHWQKAHNLFMSFLTVFVHSFRFFVCGEMGLNLYMVMMICDRSRGFRFYYLFLIYS